MQNKGLLIGLGALLLVALAAGGYFLISMNNPNPTQRAQETTTTQPVTGTPTNTGSGTTTDEESAQVIEVEAKEFSFTPSNLNIKAEQKVRVVFTNTGKMPHDFVIEELNIRTKVLSPGASETLEFTPEKAGVLTFYCSVGNHRAQGMEGQITVD